MIENGGADRSRQIPVQCGRRPAGELVADRIADGATQLIGEMRLPDGGSVDRQAAKV
jgi:hypothetical protein